MAAAELAAWLDSYGVVLRDSLRVAASQGYRLARANTASGELDPRAFTDSARRHLRKYLRDIGLQLDGLSLHYAGAGLADAATAAERLARLKGTLELCAALDVRHAGVSLGGFDDPRSAGLAREMVGEVADLADRIGVRTAILVPAGAWESAGAHVRRLGCPALRLAVDTAALPSADALAAAADLLGDVHLRDVRPVGERVEEVPFGQGVVDFRALLAQVAAGPTDARLIVRHDGAGGVDALRQGREYMESMIGRPERR